MKKLLVALALLTVSTLGYADDDEVKVVSGNSHTLDGADSIWIVDGKKVYRCIWEHYPTGDHKSCGLIASDYTKDYTKSK
tara:strand:- start:74 stop:313 length:240 start_codon:yes stop_codon:yes gene_type:complete